MGAGDEADARPLLLAEEPSSSGDISPLLASLRLFSCGQVDDSAFPPGAEEGELLPALLHPYRNPERVRQDYPLFLAPGGERPCLPLSELLEELLKAAAPGAEEARVLKDNLARLERRVRDEIEPGIASVEARECLLRASRAMEEELELDVESAARLQGDTAAMLRGLPEGGRLLPLSEETFIPLLVHAARERLIGRWALFRAEIESLCGALQALLDIEDSKAPEAREARSLRESVGSAGAGRIDAEALASVLGPSRGSARMTPERRHRIEGVLETLRGGLESGEEPRVTIIHEGSLAATATDLGEDPGVDPLACWRGVEAEAPCARAAELFDEEAARHASLCAAVRVAKLEVAGGFDPERHQPFLTAFNWEAFSREELLLMSPLVAIAPVESLAGDGMAELSSLIRSGRPVKVLVAVQPAVNPGAGEDPAAGCRFELGYLGISHREALVVQSSAARPEHLVTGFLRAMDATRVTLLVTSTGLTAGGERPRVGSWLEVGAALEGRAHPFFIYDPEAGRTWARRMEFTGNPHPELDWPLYDLEYRAEGRRAETLSLAFTFADYALLEPSCSHHFRAIPPGCPAGDLLDLADYLDLDGEETIGRIPFIWAVDEGSHLRRLAVSRRLVGACRDRLDFWRTLQELAGIHNEYVREAVEKARAEKQEESDRALQQQRREHEAEMEQMRSEAAGEAMRRLAGMLLELDLGAPLPRGAASPPAAPTHPSAAGAHGAPAAAAGRTAAEGGEGEDALPGPQDGAVAEAEGAVLEEPWIDSALCTSCNDCLEINGQLFIYNANKQAEIGDPRAGTYAQLVTAAEKCPARCIHPGRPLNPEETGLDDWIRRAEPFL